MRTDLSATPALLSNHSTRAVLGDLSQSTVDRLVRDGKLRRVHVGRRALIVAADVERLVAELEATVSGAREG